MENVFFAILPDKAAKARIAALATQLREARGLQAAPVAADRLHVSLHWVGDEKSPGSVIEVAKAAAASVDASCFHLAFDRVVTFNGARRVPIVLTSSVLLPPLMSLCRSIGAELKRAGLEYPVRTSFTPHLAFLYGRHAVDPVEIDPIAWTVRDFVLIRSLYGRSRHIHLARWPLHS